MRRWLALAALALTSAAPPPPRAPVQLWRIDCGRLVDEDLAAYSDTYALEGQRATLVVPCYLIRHGDDYMVWDAGLPRRYLHAHTTATDNGELAVPIEDALGQLHLTPDRVGLVGISHYHFDHSGQLPALGRAMLLIGAGDWDVVRGTRAADGLDRAPFARWLTGGGKVVAVAGDHDVFGDGSVVMLALPGHTPGHHGLLVRLAGRGPVLLSGDLWHTASNYATRGVPRFNTDRAQTLASFDRFKQLATTLRATVILEHVAADVDKLPPFPRAAQ